MTIKASVPSLAAVLASFVVSDATAQNFTISWLQPQLHTTVFPGTTTRIPVRFTSRATLPDIVVSLTPSFKGMVSVSPNLLQTIVANQEYTLSVFVAAPPTFQRRTVGGTLHLRSRNGSGRTYSRPLPISISIDFRTYTDGQLGVTFSHPTEWTIVRTGDTLHVSGSERVALRTAPEEVESPPEITIVVLSNPQKTPVQAFADGFAAGWFRNYKSAASSVIGNREARRYSDWGATLGHSPPEAAFVAGDDSVVLLTLNDPETEDDSTLEVFRGIVTTLFVL